MRVSLLLIFLFGISFQNQSNGQGNAGRVEWRRLEGLISHKLELDRAEKSLENIANSAKKDGRWIDLIRSQHLLLSIKDERTEDTLFFQNSHFIDSLLSVAQESRVMEFCLHLMKTERIMGFRSMVKRYALEKYRDHLGPSPYAFMGPSSLDSVIALHFEKALAIAPEIPLSQVCELLWLSRDPLSIFFPVTAFDIAMGNQVGWQVRKYEFWEIPYLSFPARLQESPDLWIDRTKKLDSSLNYYLLAKSFADWFCYHENNPPALYYLESLWRKWWMGLWKYSDILDLQENYMDYLRQQTFSPFSSVRAHTGFQLIELYAKRADNYLPASVREYSSDFGWQHNASYQQFDSSYRFYADSAIALWQRLQPTLDSFHFLKPLLLTHINKLLRPDLRFRMPAMHLPNEPILVELIYRHPQGVDLEIYRKNEKRNSFSYDSSIVWIGQAELPDKGDFNQHILHHKLPALGAGKYILKAQVKHQDGSSIVQLGSFSVSGIGIIHGNGNVIVLDRKSGQPLSDAMVVGYRVNHIYGKGPNEMQVDRQKTDRNGRVYFRDREINAVEVTYADEHFRAAVDLESMLDSRDEFDYYNKDEYDDLIEFYEDHTTAYIFTDRSIYRPGDTVGFKAVFITKHPVTGQYMLLNRKNLRRKTIGSLFPKFMKVSEPTLNLVDAFNKQVDSVAVNINEWGSFAGKFVIPLTASTGEWDIETDYFEQEGGSFSVEEYKRPGFEVSIQSPKTELGIGDPFEFMVKLRSFAGASMEGSKVNYQVLRRVFVQTGIEQFEKKEISLADSVLLDDVASVLPNGICSISVNDTVWRSLNFSDTVRFRISYTIEATVSDPGGETHEASEQINVSNKPVRIDYSGNAVENIAEWKGLSYKLIHENFGKLSKTIRVRVGRLQLQAGEGIHYYSLPTDVANQPYDSLSVWFSKYYPEQPEQQGSTVWFLDSTFSADNDSIFASLSTIGAGRYQIEVYALEKNKVVGSLEHRITLFDLDGKQAPVSNSTFIHLPFNAGIAGTDIPLYFGKNEDAYYLLLCMSYATERGEQKEEFYAVQGRRGVEKLMVRIPATAKGQAELAVMGYWNNEELNWKRTIQILNKPSVDPEIVVETYRQVLLPGAPQKFEVSVKAGKEYLLAELMTTMYDASLDKLETHEWELPRLAKNFNPHFSGTQGYYGQSKSYGSQFLKYDLPTISGHDSNQNTPVWWMSAEGGHCFPDSGASWMNNIRYSLYPQQQGENLSYALQGRVAGIAVTSMEEVVVLGFGTKRLSTRSSVIHVSGITSLEAYSQPMVIVDGVLYTGSIAELSPAGIKGGLVLKGADATALYGSRASNGVLILSTKGPVELSQVQPLDEIVVRKNFHPSAFFIPQLLARDGRYIISFTLPESATEWRWKLFAHSSDLRIAYHERLLQSRLPLLAQSQLPRFLYPGDSIVLTVRVSNLDTLTQKGIAWCSLKDVHNTNISKGLNPGNSEQSFELAPQQSASFFFPLKVPAEGIESLNITMGARTANYGDAEMHQVPVLSKDVLVSHAQPIYFVGKDTLLHPPVPIPAGKWYGTSIGLKPLPSESLLEALRYMSSFPFNCAEQLTNKVFAGLVAADLLRKDSSWRSLYSIWSERVKEKRYSSGEDFGDLSRPWLSLEQDEWIRNKELFNLFDEGISRIRLSKQLAELKGLQNQDGGMSWFPGGESNSYISTYVLRKLGEMNKMNLFIALPESEKNVLTQLIEGLVDYTDIRLRRSAGDLENELSENRLLARSYWIKQHPNFNASSAIWRQSNGVSGMNLKERSPVSTGPLLLASLQWKDSILQKVDIDGIVENWKARAIQDERNGIRWREYSNNPLPTTPQMEGLSAVLSVFEMKNPTGEWAAGIQRWLRQKSWPLNWPNTRFASAYVSMLQTAIADSNDTEPSLEWRQGTEVKYLSQAAMGRSSALFRRAVPAEPVVNLRKLGTGDANPTLVWHYFTSNPDEVFKVPGLHIRQSFLRWDKNLEQWVVMDSTADLELGDKVLLQLKLHSNKLLEYVQIETFFPACLSPTDGRSRRTYFNGNSGYISVRDERLDVFSDRIDEGDAIISFEMKVEKKGEFLFRPSVLRCMYAMELSAYGKGGMLRVR